MLITCQEYFKIYEKQVGNKEADYIFKSDSSFIDITDNNK